MREIKFRAWDKVCECMVNPGSGKHFRLYLNGSMSIEDCWATQDVILMQFTGLKDKNGKEIYEGDIVTKLNLNRFKKDGELDRSGCLEYIEWGIVEFLFPTCQFMLARRKGADSYNNSIEFKFSSESLEFEVIGNIYENPELIKKEVENGGEI